MSLGSVASGSRFLDSAVTYSQPDAARAVSYGALSGSSGIVGLMGSATSTLQVSLGKRWKNILHYQISLSLFE